MGPAALHGAWEWLVNGRGRLVLVAVTVVFGVSALAVTMVIIQVQGMGLDYGIYMDRTRDFVAGRGFYLPRQLAGPYTVMNGDALYPPPSLVLFIPFLYLPPALYWAIPLTITAAVVIYHRPAIWAWPIIAFISLWNHYLAWEITKGNPGLWTLALLSLGTVWPFFAPFTALKLGLAPFALFGIWRRQWWVGAGVALVISAAFLPMWFDYFRVLRDVRGDSLEYIVGEYPMMLIPLVAWLARRRVPDASPDQPVLAEPLVSSAVPER